MATKRSANDLVQEGLKTMGNNCTKVTQDKETKSFLYTVATTSFEWGCIEKVVLKRATTHENRWPVLPNIYWEEKQYQQKLQNAIANLTEAQQNCFLLNRMKEKNIPEIADILDFSIKAVEKGWVRALAALRKEMKNFKKVG